MKIRKSGILRKGKASEGRKLAAQIKFGRQRLRPYLAKLRAGEALSKSEKEELLFLKRQIDEAKNALERLGFDVEKSVVLASVRDAHLAPARKKNTRVASKKSPTYPPNTGKKARKEILKKWLNSLSEEDRKEWEREQAHSQKQGKNRYMPNPMPETPRSFTKDELRKIDWTNT